MGYCTGEQMRRVVCLMIAVIMIFSVNAVDVSAAKKDHQREGRSEWRQEDYERVNHTLNYLGYGEDDKVYYTEFQETVKEQNRTKYVSFIYDDKRAIGQYIKEETDDDVNECFIINKESELLNSLIEYHEGREFEIRQEENVIGASALDGAEKYQYGTISKGNATYITGSSPSGAFLPANYVPNRNNPNTGEGLCWAACGACVANYYKGKNYDTLYMYYYVKPESGEEPIGSVEWEKMMFNLLYLDYDYLERRLSYNQILVALKNNSLIFYNLQKEEGIGHGAILCGAFRISSTLGYIYMDPNVSGGYVLNYLDLSDGVTTTGNFYYYNGKIRYTWISSMFYNFRTK